MPASPETYAAAGAVWPPAEDRPFVLLLAPESDADRRLLGEWAQASWPVAGSGDRAIELAADDAALVYPVRMAWLPPGVDGDRRWRKRDLWRMGLGGTNDRWRQHVLSAEPERCRVLVGEPASLGDLRARMTEHDPDAEAGGLGEFVELQARRALDRTERLLTGARYKVPDAVKTDMLADPGFNAGLAKLAAEVGKSEEAVKLQILDYLEEMATEQNAVVREMWARFAQLMYSRAYDLVYDEEALEAVRKLGESHPLVFLPTHKSNLDSFVMNRLLYEAGFPLQHMLGGVNMAFWPIGPIARHVGVIFIRRNIKSDPVYRFLLRQYLGYLVKRRFNLEWYIEGGRTRTGKLLPPKMGLLHYLVDAVDAAGSDDVQLVPVSIVYDHLSEVADMAAESRGAIKQAEGLRWLIGYARRLNQPAGRIQVRIGEVFAMTPALAEHGVAENPRLALSKLAFDVCTRMNRATPVTPIGLATLALLGVDGRALTAEEVIEAIEPLLRYAEARKLPGLEEARDLRTFTGVEAALSRLVAGGVVSRYADGPEPVYAISRENELVAAFYRNTVIHWFVNRAIGELALVGLVGAEGESDPIAWAWDEAFRIRDLLKFEFFFTDSEQWRVEMREELALISPEWSSTGELSLNDVARGVADSGAVMAHRVLMSFLETIYVVSEALLDWPLARDVDQEKFIEGCLALGEQMRRQKRIVSGEAVSRELFATALKLAGNRKLLDPELPDLAEQRAAFAAELRELVARVRLLADLDHLRGRDSVESLSRLEVSA